MIFLFQLAQQSCLSLPGLDLGTQIFSLGFQLGHNFFTLLQQGLQILDLLVLVSDLTQHLLQVVLQHTLKQQLRRKAKYQFMSS